MTGKCFVDTNILVYSVDLRAGVKREIARSLLDDRRAEPLKVVSTQVLQEFYVTCVGKLGYAAPQAREMTQMWASLSVVGIGAHDVLEAIDCSVLNRISFWDALIVTAARKAACRVLWTEDLSDGQIINGVLIENPFLRGKTVHEPAATYRARRPARTRK